MNHLEDVGCVAIGRNEGERLERCLRSVVAGIERAKIVYVDSGSTDESVTFARRLGVDVVELDLRQPFTAARARNEGFERLLANHPAIGYVQFVDGDCEIVEGWLDRARARLGERPDLAVVCGRRRERFPESSLYNRLCDLEWDTPVGDVEACGGDAMMRVEALRRVGAFDPKLICGEEPELCLRLRRSGFAVERIDAEMTLHDAAITEFRQWWKRNVRAGYAYAEGASTHGEEAEGYAKEDLRRILFWGGLPTVALGAGLPTLGLSLFLFGAYPLSALRVYRSERTRGRSHEDAALYAAFCVLGRFPELQGVMRYHLHRLRGLRSNLIEYK